MASLAAFAAASMVAGLSSSPGLLIAARVAQGASAAFAQATALSLIVSTFPAGRARNRAVGVFAAMEGLGAAAGLLLGGILVQAVSWRWVFFVNVPVAAIVAALAPRFIPSPKRQSLRLDLPGAVTASAGLGLIVFGLSRAADHGWTDIWTAEGGGESGAGDERRGGEHDRGDRRREREVGRPAGSDRAERILDLPDALHVGNDRASERGTAIAPQRGAPATLRSCRPSRPRLSGPGCPGTPAFRSLRERPPT